MKLRNVLLVIAILASTTSAGADDTTDAGVEAPEKVEGPKLDLLIADIGKARKDLKTLRSSFTQERRITLLATSVKSRGELLVAAPDRLRWDLAAPDDVIYFVGPEGLSYKTKSSSSTLPSTAGTNVARALTDLRALLTGDLAPLRERYVLGGSRTTIEVEITGVARDKAASVKSFTLVLDKGLMVPRRARLVEGKSDGVDLVFSNVVVNGPIDPARLRP